MTNKLSKTKMGSSIVSNVLNEKNNLTGVAMILIIMCHLGVVAPELFQYYPFLKVFVPGFIGVDIFLFFSGYSLGYSLEKRGLKSFYTKRVKRIYPMFAVFATLSTIVYILKGHEVTLFDWFCNISTLSYYHIGGEPIDWYLSSIALFYITYPLCQQYIRKYKLGGVVLLAVIVFLLTTYNDFQEYYGCAISRIPIFVFGIYLFEIKDSVILAKNYNTLSLIFIIIGLLAVVMMKFGYRIHGYFLVDTIAPIFMCLLTWIITCYRRFSIHNIVNRCLSFLGRHSLDIYISNYLSMNIIGLFLEYNMYKIALLYMGLNIVGSVVMIYLNKVLSSLIR